MNVEELYWKLRELRQQGHSEKRVLLYTGDDEGVQEFIDTIDNVEIEGTGPYIGSVFLTGERA